MNKSENVTDMNTIISDFIVDWIDPIDGMRTTYGVVDTLANIIERFNEKGKVLRVYDASGEVWRPATHSRMG